VNRWDLEDHLLKEHKLDDTDPAAAADEELEKAHGEAHRVGQLIWREHSHTEASR
jgi:hypothetical protein